MDKNRSKATVSLDLDNQWAYLRTHGDNSWQSFPSFLETAGPRILEFFEQHEIKPTIFVVGRDLESDTNLRVVKRFVEAGFEIGNHTYNHRSDFHGLDDTLLSQEVLACENVVAKKTGGKPVGFRGPSFQVSDKIAEVLIKAGYRYDASSYPTSIAPLLRLYHFFHSQLTPEEKKSQQNLFGGFASAFSTLDRHSWQVKENSIIEIPVTTMPFLRLPIHFTYLNYLADRSPRLGMAYFKTSMWLMPIAKVTPSFLLHATDFLGSDDSPIPHFLPGMKRPFAEKLNFLNDVFAVINRRYQLLGLDSYLSASEV